MANRPYKNIVRFAENLSREIGEGGGEEMEKDLEIVLKYKLNTLQTEQTGFGDYQEIVVKTDNKKSYSKMKNFEFPNIQIFFELEYWYGDPSTSTTYKGTDVQCAKYNTLRLVGYENAAYTVTDKKIICYTGYYAFFIPAYICITFNDEDESFESVEEGY